MNISILGTGNMATGLAVLFAKAGHTVTLGSRDAEKAKAVASKSRQRHRWRGACRRGRQG